MDAQAKITTPTMSEFIMAGMDMNSGHFRLSRLAFLAKCHMLKRDPAKAPLTDHFASNGCMWDVWEWYGQRLSRIGVIA